MKAWLEGVAYALSPRMKPAVIETIARRLKVSNPALAEQGYQDLLRATDIARAMVTEWGMSDSVGAINYAGEKRNRFLDVAMPNERGIYAEETARLERHGGALVSLVYHPTGRLLSS